MLALLLLWFYLFAFASAAGFIVAVVISNTLQLKDRPLLSPALYLSIGFAGISGLLAYLSLFSPLGLPAHLLVFSLLTAGLVYLKKSSWPLRFAKSANRSPIFVSAFFLLFVSLLWLSSLEPTNYDTGLYHAQVVRWIEEFKVVPGLGNLHLRLAFNSSWFLLTALFNVSFLKLGTIHVLNGVFLFVCMWSFFQQQNRFFDKNNRLPAIFASFLVGAASFFAAPTVSSTDPDKPVMLLLWLIFLFFIKRQIDSEREDPLLDFLLILLSVFVITIKLSALPIGLIPVYLIVSRWLQGHKRFVRLALFASFFLLLPWLIRNVIQSGYLLYPFAGLDLFSFDWKIPKHIAEYSHLVILAFARVPYADIDYVLALPFASWIQFWLARTPIHIHFFLFLGIFGNLFLILQHWKGRQHRIDRIFLPALFLIALFYWFINAPAPRFGLGFIVPAAGLPVAALADHVLKKASLNAIRRFNTGLQTFSLAAIVFVFALAFYTGSFNSKMWLLPPQQSMPSYHVEMIDGFQVFVPDVGDRCWYAPLPCTPSPQSGFYFRGTTLQEGFGMDIDKARFDLYDFFKGVLP
jgi:hypothetical protein